MSENEKNPNRVRFLAEIEADIVLVDRDLQLVIKRMQTLSDQFSRALGTENKDKVNREYQFYNRKRDQLLQEKYRLEEEKSALEGSQK